MTDTKRILERLDEVEAECRTAKRWRNALLLLLSCPWVMTCQSPRVAPEGTTTIQAQEFRLVDGRGRLLGVWGPDATDEDPGSSALQLLGWADGRIPNEVIVFRTLGGGGEIGLKGEAEHGEVWLTNEDQRGRVALFNSCKDPGHGDGIVHMGLASIEAGPETGRIEIKTFEAKQLAGMHVDDTSVVFRVPESR